MGENLGLGQTSAAERTEAEKIRVEEFESTPRKLPKRVDFFLGISMVALSLFQLYTSWQGPFPDLIQRSIHLGFILPAALLMYPPFRKSRNRDNIPFVDKVLMLLAVIASLWVTFNYERIQLNPGVSTTVDLLLAPIMIFAILETSRRTLGPALPIIVLLLLLYALLGPYVPGDWAHRGFSPRMLLQLLYLEPDGIFGFVVGISATIIAGFLIFGVILSETGGGDTFIDLAVRLAGRSPGGPAKVSCFFECLFRYHFGECSGKRGC